MGSDILEVLREHLPELRRGYGVMRIGVFGSAARGDMRLDSDVDVLVEFAETGFDAYMGLKFYLEDLLGRPVDLVTPGAVKPLLRDRILREIKYAA